jgi:hypothetical protein
LKNLYIAKSWNLQSWNLTCIWASFFSISCEPL